MKLRLPAPPYSLQVRLAAGFVALTLLAAVTVAWGVGALLVGLLVAGGCAALAVGSTMQRLRDANEDLARQLRERTRDLQAANDELARQAQTDPLTGLLNRRVFDPMLERMLADARRNRRALSVLMIDTDHFGRITDRHGQPVGDQVLRMLADTLRSRLRGSDVIARFDGEAFGVLLPETGEAEALITAQALVDLVAAQNHRVWGKVTVSIGAATCGDGLLSAQELLRQADEALDRAKAEGRDRVCTARRG